MSHVNVTAHALDQAHQRFQIPRDRVLEWVLAHYAEATKVEHRAGAVRLAAPDGVEFVARPEHDGVVVLTVYQASPGRRFQRRKKARWSKAEREHWRHHVKWRRQITSDGRHHPFTNERRTP